MTLRNAQKNSSMEGVLWKNVGFRMGGRKYFCDFVEVDINDSLILGIDFFRKCSCKVDFGRSVVEMSNGEEVFTSYHRQDSGSFHISRVLASKKVSIKPRTAKRIKAKFEYPVDAPFTVKPTSRKDLFAPSIVVNGAQSVEILVMNLTDHHITLKRNSLLGTATDIDAMLVARKDREEGGPVADLYVCKSQGPPAPPELKVCAVSLEDNEPKVTVEDGYLAPEEEVLCSPLEPTVVTGGEDGTRTLSEEAVESFHPGPTMALGGKITLNLWAGP